MNINLLYVLYRFFSFLLIHRSLLVGALVIGWVIGLDVAFHHYLSYLLTANQPSWFWRVFEAAKSIDIGFAPEVWLSVTSLTLGTLIIIVSIASQSIPKLIDLYIEDWYSLFYVWFLVISSTHIIFIKFNNEIGFSRTSSIILNIYFFLPISIIFALPYIFYILKSTQPSDVITNIFNGQLRRIQFLNHPFSRKLLGVRAFVREFQYNLFKSLSQLDNMLEYISFKESKAQIIQDMGTLVQEYIKVKPCLGADFFKVGSKIKDDISFRTMMGQFHDVEQSRSFYEQKCFRLLGNTYIKLINDQEFDLASLCGLEITKIGHTALEYQDDLLISVVIIRFNTMLRFALKHGVKNNEARNLYNMIFHYRNFINDLVKYGKLEFAQQSFYYLRVYGTEIYRHGRISPSMYFIVDVFAAEMKQILILVHQQNWPFEVQRELLNEMLQIDNPPDFTEGDLDRGQLLNNGVRILQIGLALYYLRENCLEFVHRIISDILDDLKVLGESAFRRSIDFACYRLRRSSSNFWEDTDRGNLNLYYTPEQAQIERFLEVLDDQLKTHHHRELSLDGPVE